MRARAVRDDPGECRNAQLGGCWSGSMPFAYGQAEKSALCRHDADTLTSMVQRRGDPRPPLTRNLEGGATERSVLDTVWYCRPMDARENLPPVVLRP